MASDEPDRVNLSVWRRIKLFLDGNELTHSCSLVCVFIFPVAGVLVSMHGGKITTPPPPSWFHLSLHLMGGAPLPPDVTVSGCFHECSCKNTDLDKLERLDRFLNIFIIFLPSSRTDMSTAALLQTVASRDEQISTGNASSEPETPNINKTLFNI